MASISPILFFVLGIVVTVILIAIFYYSARTNRNVSKFYQEKLCSNLA